MIESKKNLSFISLVFQFLKGKGIFYAGSCGQATGNKRGGELLNIGYFLEIVFHVFRVCMKIQVLSALLFLALKICMKVQALGILLALAIKKNLIALRVHSIFTRVAFLRELHFLSAPSISFLPYFLWLGHRIQHKIKINANVFIYALLFAFSGTTYGMLLDTDFDAAALDRKIQASEKIMEKKRSIASASSELVEFKYDQKNLKDLVNEFAQKLKINILYPETETITSKVTFDAGRRITMAEAWDFVVMILEQAGFTLVLRGNGIYALITNTKAFNEPLPIYVNVDYALLPDNVERMRYVYYLNSIQLSKPTQQKELTTVLDSVLGAEVAKQVISDPSANLIIITGRSDMIKTVMQLITILDESGFQEALEVMKLEYVRADDVAKILKEVTASGDPKPNKVAVSLSSGQRSRLFSEYARVEPLGAKESKRPLNAVVIMGKEADVAEIKKFIKKYLDIPLETGESFFHVVDLQWLNATQFATTLQNFISGGGGSSSQSSSTLSSDLAFDAQVKVVAETITKGAGSSGIGSNLAATSANAIAANTSQTANQNVVQRGSNRLIIACSPKDWVRIDSLIKQLDIPQKQVVIEALIMDLDLAFTRQLGSQIRTRGLESSIFPTNMQAQAGLLINNIIETATDSSNYSLLGDLSDILNPQGVYADNPGSISTPAQTSLTGSGPAADGVNNGSTIFMINGGKARTNGVWAFFQLLSTHTSSKVFTRPVLMVQNNQQASVNSTVVKTIAGAVTSSVNPTVNFQQQSAPISITFTPLISENNTVNLQLVATMQNWLVVDDASGTQTVRQLNTNVSMKSGDLLILGGLISDSTQTSKRSVPFFDRIPVFGSLFASRKKTSTKDQLYILIRVTVVEPRTEGGMGAVTRTAADFMIDQLAETEETFSSLKDPVTRWFFNGDRKQSASEYMEEKISELPAFDLGRSGDNIELDDRVVHLPRKTTDDMKVGWFSDHPSNSNFASKSSTSGDMDTLSKFLKDLDNPFERRLQV